LGDRITPIEDTSEGYFLIPACLNPEQVYMTFNEYIGGDKGQDLRNLERGFFKAVNYVIEVGIDEFSRNRVIRKIKDFWDDYTVIVDVYIHGNEKTREDLTPVMKHFNPKYYRVLVECLRDLSVMAADYYVTAAKSYKKCSKRPGDGHSSFVFDAEEKWSFYWSMRRLIVLENIERIFDKIAVMIFPVFATAPVCEKQFIRVKQYGTF
jgi:hypothetical protein